MTPLEEEIERWKAEQRRKSKIDDGFNNTVLILGFIMVFSVFVMFINFPIGLLIFVICFFIYITIEFFTGLGDGSEIDTHQFKPPVIPVVTSNECNHCHGTGRCHYCHGTGYMGTTSVYRDEEKYHVIKCIACNSTGACRMCEGKGYK